MFGSNFASAGAALALAGPIEKAEKVDATSFFSTYYFIRCETHRKAYAHTYAHSHSLTHSLTHSFAPTYIRTTILPKQTSHVQHTFTYLSIHEKALYWWCAEIVGKDSVCWEFTLISVKVELTNFKNTPALHKSDLPSKLFPFGLWPTSLHYNIIQKELTFWMTSKVLAMASYLWQNNVGWMSISISFLIRMWQEFLLLAKLMIFI